jgi:hypothetical protein
MYNNTKTDNIGKELKNPWPGKRLPTTVERKKGRGN